MDYAKRAAKLVQCESNNGYWLTSIDGRYLADGHGENAADVTEQIRAWLAAELQAAHDAGVAEAAPKWTPITDDKATWPGPSKNVLLTVRGYDGGPPCVVYGFRAGSHAVDGFCHSDASRMRVLPLAWMPLPMAWKPKGGR